MKRTLIVLAVLAGLASYAYFVDYKGKAKEEEAEKQAKKLVPLHQDEVTRLTILNGALRMTVAKVDGVWRMTEPVSAPADENIVTSVVTALTGAESKGEVEKPEELRAYGLAEPRIRFLVAGDGKDYEVAVGKKSPVSQDAYVMLGGKPPIYLTGANLDSTGNRKPDDLRDKQLFAFKATEITAVSVLDGANKLVIRRKDGAWRIESPQKLAADTTVADGLAADFVNLRATGWIAEAADPAVLADKGLAKPSTVLEAELASGATQRIYVGALDGNDRAARIEGRPQVIKLADWAIKNMLKTPAELKDRRLVAFNKDAVAKLEFTAGKDTVGFRREGPHWMVETNSSNEGNTTKINELVDAVVDLRANEWAPVAGATLREKELDRPGRTITLYDAAGKRLTTLKFGKEEDNWAVWVLGDDPGFIAKTPNDFVKNHWPTAPVEYFAAPVTN